MLQAGRVDRIVLSRPAVEAGERLGFLPGDLKEKVDPYLRPLYDALHDMMPGDQVIRRMGTGEIEVAPLAFMRGRTLAHAFVILDEAQNTTPVQMKMFLTRMGEGTRMVITGDLSQIDLPPGQRSGLRDALDTLEGLPGIGVTRFGVARRGAASAGGRHRRRLRPAGAGAARRGRRRWAAATWTRTVDAAPPPAEPVGAGSHRRRPALAPPGARGPSAWRGARPRVGRRRRRPCCWPRTRRAPAERAPSRPQQADQRADLRRAATSCSRSASCGARRGRSGSRPAHHLAHLVVHGALHLQGHDHDQPGEARRMEMAEARLLRRIGVPNPWRAGMSGHAAARAASWSRRAATCSAGAAPSTTCAKASPSWCSNPPTQTAGGRRAAGAGPAGAGADRQRAAAARHHGRRRHGAARRHRGHPGRPDAGAGAGADPAGGPLAPAGVSRAAGRHRRHGPHQGRVRLRGPARRSSGSRRSCAAR